MAIASKSTIRRDIYRAFYLLITGSITDSQIPARSIPNWCFSCVPIDVRCLTREGWKYYNELRDGEEIVSYNQKTDSFDFSVPTLNVFPFSGEVTRINHRHLKTVFTPNHRMLVYSRGKDTQRVINAKNLTESYEIPSACKGMDNKSNLKISDSMTSLLGWVATEGHFQQHSGIYLYQSHRNEDKLTEIIRILDELNLHYTRKTRMRKLSPHGQEEIYVFAESAKKIRSILDSKHLHSEFIFNIDKHQRSILLASLIAGDGHTRPDGTIFYTQKCKKCAETVQILSLMNGYSAYCYKSKSRDIYSVTITKRKRINLHRGRVKTVSKINYSGKVWCPTVNTGFWLAEINGKPFITGNSFPEVKELSESSFPIVVFGMPTITTSQFTIPKRQITFNMDIEVYTSGDKSAQANNTLADQIYDIFDTAKYTNLRNDKRFYPVHIVGEDEDTLLFDQMKVHYSRISVSGVFRHA